jgi:DNA polymerase-3 subunit epsilon
MSTLDMRMTIRSLQLGVEIGLSWADQNLEVQTFDSLIRSAPEWPEDAWSPASAAIHNITRHDLDKAPDVVTVARALLHALKGRIALSDAVPFERHWLDQLFGAAGISEHMRSQRGARVS